MDFLQVLDAVCELVFENFEDISLITCASNSLREIPEIQNRNKKLETFLEKVSRRQANCVCISLFKSENEA